MSQTDQKRREIIRHETLGFLAERQSLAHAVETITRRLNQERVVDGKISDEEVLSALTLLEGMKLVRVERDPLGSSHYYTATSEGVLAHEREG